MAESNQEGKTSVGGRQKWPNFVKTKEGYKRIQPAARFFLWIFAGVVVAVAVRLPAVQQIWDSHGSKYFVLAAVIFLSILLLRTSRSNPVYLMEVSCFRPPDILRAPHTTFLEHSKISGNFSDKSLEFQRKILERSGLGQHTAFPMCFRYLPPCPSAASAREEAEAVLFGCMDDLLVKTKINPKDISVVVVNCSTLNPTPSLSAMIVNKYKLRSNVRTYNLGGMGCSAGVIALDLANTALLVHKDTYAVVFSTENITQNWYWGNNRTMLVSNCLFRVGGGAILLSNKTSDRWLAKYRLEHVVRTHTGADDAAYHAAYQEEDEEGEVGVFLSKDLMRIAAETLRTNMTTLGPLVLPYREQMQFLANYVWRVVFKAKVPKYVPDFKSAFDHFCIHSGGRAVIAAVEKGLRLSAIDVEPSKMTLHRFGNTSASTTWYQFQYLEAKGRVRKGDKVWQIAFGSGFKCNSAVWRALRTIGPAADSKNAWTDCILNYPVPTPELQEF